MLFRKDKELISKYKKAAKETEEQRREGRKKQAEAEISSWIDMAKNGESVIVLATPKECESYFKAHNIKYKRIRGIIEDKYIIEYKGKYIKVRMTGWWWE